MPTIDVPLTVTTEQVSAFRSWFARYNATIATPYASEIEFLQEICMQQIRTAVRAEDTADDILEIWKSLTDSQRTRIRAIVTE